jgi:limonene-1,2-epoxide hydrolase
MKDSMTASEKIPAKTGSGSEQVQKIVVFFEALSSSDLKRLGDFYAIDARFKDPFNQVQGLAEIERIFSHMFVNLESPRFIITTRIEEGLQCFLTWEFRFQFKRFHRGIEQVVLGGSHLVLDDAGRITLHRDYWDAAEEMYEKLPLLGSLMRWLKKRAIA